MKRLLEQQHRSRAECLLDLDLTTIPSSPMPRAVRQQQIGKDLVAASATPLLLAILQKGPSYGYAIIQEVRELSGGELEWSEGMLYPVLHRLEDQGLIDPTRSAATRVASAATTGSGRWTQGTRSGATPVGRRARCTHEGMEDCMKDVDRHDRQQHSGRTSMTEASAPRPKRERGRGRPRPSASRSPARSRPSSASTASSSGRGGDRER